MRFLQCGCVCEFPAEEAAAPVLHTHAHTHTFLQFVCHWSSCAAATEGNTELGRCDSAVLLLAAACQNAGAWNVITETHHLTCMTSERNQDTNRTSPGDVLRFYWSLQSTRRNSFNQNQRKVHVMFQFWKLKFWQGCSQCLYLTVSHCGWRQFLIVLPDFFLTIIWSCFCIPSCFQML